MVKLDEFEARFVPIVMRLAAIRRLCEQVDEIRSRPVSRDNPDHSAQLLVIWRSLVGEKDPVGESEGAGDRRIHWPDIGFQGNDPSTDFRAAGCFALHQLYHLSRYQSSLAQRIFLKSRHPKFGFDYCLTGINLSYRLVFCGFTDAGRSSGKAQLHGENVSDLPVRAALNRLVPMAVVHANGQTDDPLRIEHLHLVFGHLFHSFSLFWQSNEPENIMAFNELLCRYADDQLRLELKSSALDALLSAVTGH